MNRWPLVALLLVVALLAGAVVLLPKDTPRLRARSNLGEQISERLDIGSECPAR